MADAPEVQATYKEAPGGTIQPLYSERKMRCFTVTNSELHQLSFANGLMTVFFSIGSAFLAFGLDITKDVILSTSVPGEAKTIVNLAQPLLYALGIAFYVAGVLTVIWRRSMLNVIKDESTH